MNEFDNDLDSEPDLSQDKEYKTFQKAFKIITPLLTNEKFVVSLRNYLKQITSEKYRCIATFKFVLNDIKSEFGLAQKDIDAIFKETSLYIRSIPFHETFDHYNYHIYTNVTDRLEIEFKEYNIPVSTSIIKKLLLKANQPEHFDKICQSYKDMINHRDLTKNVKSKEQIEYDKERPRGAILVAAEGKKLSSFEETHNLAQGRIKTTLENHKLILDNLIGNFNKLHPKKPISDRVAKDTFALWSEIQQSGEGETKKHVETYLAYALKLVDPSIKFYELDTAMTKDFDTVKKYKTYFTDFFNNLDSRKKKMYEIYEKRHEEYLIGHMFDVSKIVSFLESVDIPKKIIDEVKQIHSQKELDAFLEYNKLYTHYTTKSGEKTKLTRKFVADSTRVKLE